MTDTNKDAKSLKNIHFEPEVIEDIYSCLGINKPKETFQQIVEQNLIKAGYRIGYYECIHKNQMTKNNPAPDIIEIGGIKYQKVVEEPKEPQTLYDALELPNCAYGYYFSEEQKDWICKVVEEWLSQFHPENMSFENLSYSNAFFDALELARKTLR